MLRRRLRRGARVYAQAEQIWTLLTGYLKWSGARTITYGQLALAMGYPTAQAGHTLARPLGLIGHMCLRNNLPPLNAMVVATHGQPGAEVILRPGSTVEADQAAVMAEDWTAWHPPTMGAFRALWEEISK